MNKNVVMVLPNDDKSKINCGNEKLIVHLYNIQSRLAFHLMPKLDEVILRLTESGVLNKWMILQIHDMGLLNANASAITNMKMMGKDSFENIQGETDDLISLHIDHVGGAFLILLVGNGIALMIFVGEVIIHKFK